MTFEVGKKIEMATTNATKIRKPAAKKAVAVKKAAPALAPAAEVKKPPTKAEVVQRALAAEARVQELHGHIKGMEAAAAQRLKDLQAADDKVRQQQGRIDSLLRENDTLTRANEANVKKISELQDSNDSLSKSLSDHVRNLESRVRETENLLGRIRGLEADKAALQSRLDATTSLLDSTRMALNRIPGFVRQFFDML